MKTPEEIRNDQLRQELRDTKKDLRDAQEKVEKLKDGWAGTIELMLEQCSRNFSYSETVKLREMVKEIREL